MGNAKGHWEGDQFVVSDDEVAAAASRGGVGGILPGEPLTQIVGDDGGVAYSSPDNVPIFAFRRDGDTYDCLQVWPNGAIGTGDGTSPPYDNLVKNSALVALAATVTAQAAEIAKLSVVGDVAFCRSHESLTMPKEIGDYVYKTLSGPFGAWYPNFQDAVHVTVPVAGYSVTGGIFFYKADGTVAAIFSAHSDGTLTPNTQVSLALARTTDNTSGDLAVSGGAGANVVNSFGGSAYSYLAYLSFYKNS